MDNSTTTNTQENVSTPLNTEAGRTTVCFLRCKSFMLYYTKQCPYRVLDRIQSRIKIQTSEQEEISQSRRIGYQTAIMTMESTRVPHLNHVPLVVGILLQLPTMLSLLRALLTTLLVDNLLPPSKLDEGLRQMLLRMRQQIPMLLLPSRTGLRRKVLDDLALEPDLPNPNPPNQQLLKHRGKTKAEPFLLTRKEMI